MGSPVSLRLYQTRDGSKEFAGTLSGYDNGDVTIEVGGKTMTFSKKDVALVRLRVEF